MEILFSKLFEPSLFLFIHGQKNPEGSVKIAFGVSEKSGFFLLRWVAILIKVFKYSFCFIFVLFLLVVCMFVLFF